MEHAPDLLLLGRLGQAVAPRAVICSMIATCVLLAGCVHHPEAPGSRESDVQQRSTLESLADRNAVVTVMTYHEGVLYWREHVSEGGPGAIIALNLETGDPTELVRANALTGVEVVGDSVRVGVFEGDVAVPHELVEGSFVRIERPAGSVVASERDWEAYGQWREEGYTNLTIWWQNGTVENLLEKSDLRHRGQPTTAGGRAYDDGSHALLLVWCDAPVCDVVSYDVATGDHEVLIEIGQPPLGLSADQRLMTYMVENAWGRWDMLVVDLETGEVTTLGGRSDASIGFAWQEGGTAFWYEETAPWDADGPQKAFRSIHLDDATTCAWPVDAPGSSWSAVAVDEDMTYVGLVTDPHEPASSIYRLSLAPC